MKVKENSIFFEIGYFLLFLSLFFGDIGIDLEFISSILRYGAYICLMVQLFSKNWKTMWVIECGIALVASIIFWVITKDLYWSVITLTIFCSEAIDKESLLRKSFWYIIIYTGVVLLLCIFGIVPDIISTRSGILENSSELRRHSLGFIHSNVFPLLILYLEMYYVWINNKKAKNIVLLFFVLLQIIVYGICNSRNSLILSILLTIFSIMGKHRIFKGWFTKIFRMIDPVLVLFLSCFSFLVMFGLPYGGIWDKVDSIFSGRFRLGIFKIRAVGIHFITFLSNKEYFRDGIVLDNGYIYVALRYGICILLFFVIINYLLVKKNKDNYYALVVIFIVFIANLIDNDLADYCFLPFILIAFDFIANNSEVKKRRKKRDGNGSSSDFYI